MIENKLKTIIAYKSILIDTYILDCRIVFLGYKYHISY